ncbi:MAG: 50S ribosomal protein L9 [Patescibacteria group bacterium]|nr:50S ribosomal protein L9 [Patescibacteria group bacterium]
MQVVFTQDISGIARKNEVKTVKSGYFHNYLLPKGLAVLATKKRLVEVEKIREKEGMKLEELEKNAAEVEKKISKATLKLTHKATDKETLYAAVTEKEIVEAIKDQLKIELAEKNLKMPEHFKKVGEYEIEIDLPGGHSTKLKVVIEAE